MAISQEPVRPSLKELQRWMQRLITDPRGVEGTLAEAEETNAGLAWISDSGPVPRIERLDVYAEGYFARIQEALARDFAELRAAMGEDAFRSVVADYLVEYPSRSVSLVDVGAGLPEYLAAVHQPEQLTEVARMEWAALKARHARNVEPLDVARLQYLSEEQWATLSLRLAASVTLLQRSGQPRHMVVYRGGFQVKRKPLSALEYQVLEWIGTGCQLGQICERLERRQLEAADAPALEDWFSVWLQENIIEVTDVTRPD